MEEDEMSGSCSTHELYEMKTEFLYENPERKDLFGGINGKAITK
jgi:hypothetical protein